MKCSLGNSDFLEEISSLSHSVGFLYFFGLITEEGFFISPCYSVELCIQLLSYYKYQNCNTKAVEIRIMETAFVLKEIDSLKKKCS